MSETASLVADLERAKALIDLTYEDGYRAGLKFAITPNAQGNQRKAVELGLLDVRCNFATYGGPYICEPGYNLKDGVYRGAFIARVEGAPGPKRIDRTHYIANAINFHEPLIEALRSFLNIASHCEIRSGVCGCGASMDGHEHPMSAGHSPVDMADQVVQKAVQEAEALLARLAP
jgi:hypothetical protein